MANSAKKPQLEFLPPAHLRLVEQVCRESACENLATAAGYCRLHYIKNWKAIKRKEAVLQDGGLQRYIEELVEKYPERVISAVRQDFSSPEAFTEAMRELNLRVPPAEESIEALNSDDLDYDFDDVAED